MSAATCSSGMESSIHLLHLNQKCWVPSLRNIAMTAPYFHDGSAATLDEAVRKMAFAQLDDTLMDQQVDAIIAFLRTLTGIYRGVPVTAAAP